MRKRSIFLSNGMIPLMLVLMCALSACGLNQAGLEEADRSQVPVSTGTLNLADAPDEFGDIEFMMTKEEFAEKGFCFGDSVDIHFSNGKKMEDIPYFSTFAGEPDGLLLVGYPSLPNIKVGVSLRGNPWEQYGIQKGDTAEIFLNEAGKYKDLYEAVAFDIPQERSAYKDDYSYANFREITCGSIKPGRLYRGASPYREVAFNADGVDKLLRKHGINAVITLNSNPEDISEYLENYGDESYIKELYLSGGEYARKVALDYLSAPYKEMICEVVSGVIENETPYFVHCKMGVDRTGFCALLLESICGASYDELLADYMKSYENYGGITKESYPNQYEALKTTLFDTMLNELTGHEKGFDYSGYDFRGDARDYLLSIGLSEEQIDQLIERLTGE